MSGPRRIDVAPSIQKIGSLFIRRSYAQDNQEPKASGIEIRVPTGVRYSNSQLTINFGYAPEKSAEEARKFPIDVIYLGEDGRQIITLPVLNNCADRECPVILPIPEGASRVRFELEQHKTEFVIPSETFDYAVFKVIVHASWNDLLWTLGFSRNLKITDLDVAFEGLLLANDPAGRKPVGVVSGVTRGEANVTRIDGSLASLQVDDLIFLGDKLGTSAAGELQITFNDGTTFRLGSDSQMVIDKFVFDPNDATVLYSIVKGVFLFVPGRSGLGEPIQIRTPSGTIGIRG